MTTKWVYTFGDKKAEGNRDMRNLLGGKGAGLADMSGSGLPVPPGFTITTEVCSYYYDHEKSYPSDLEDQVREGLSQIEKITGKVFGDKENPLLVSVRSGARVSMPGMMDTVLNLGLNDDVCEGLAKKSNERFAYDSYRRFIQMYGDVVAGVPHHAFEETLYKLKRHHGLSSDTEMTVDHLKDLISQYKEIYKKHVEHDFPQDPKEQLWSAIGAVFNSWQIDRAIAYRRISNIPDTWGTAVNVQAMVFGNMGDDCATGVAFTRNPSTGTKEFYGEYLINAQGEDVVAGIRTPWPLTKEAADGGDHLSLEEKMPEAFAELSSYRETLEKRYGDMQDIEFTIENNKVYLLQTRNGKRTIWAAMKIACDMIDEGLISEEDALLRIEPDSLNQILHARIDPKQKRDILTRGLPASPGAAKGEICFHADDAEEWAHQGRSVILVRGETSPEDIHGMHAAKGIVTVRGGMTSHAAVVARGMGRPCIVGAGALHINEKEGYLEADGKRLKQGDIVTIDGGTGEVMIGDMDMIAPEFSPECHRMMELATKVKRLSVRANAETPEDAKVARNFGAEGIGLSRTEHMFFDAKRILAMREMILSDRVEDRVKALNKLLPMQREDFKELFREMSGLPVTVRLLDPPLHEFLPQKEQDFASLSKELGITMERLKHRTEQLHELNPMLGHRGCRLLNTYPEICEMQARAVFEAAIEVQKETGSEIQCEVMIPLVSMPSELDALVKVIHATADKVEQEKGERPCYILGTMIELPRAALLADKITENLSFISFGTNDLTQTTFGISRDDAASFLNDYKERGLIKKDPFASLDQEGVGALIKIALEKVKGRSLKVGICGEHGGDPDSVEFFEKNDFTYVSCSPFRVPLARLAAAQAHILRKRSS